MKLTFRIPTEQYAFAEVSLEAPESMTSSEVAALYQETADAFKPQVGLENKQWIHCVDTYMNTGTLNGGIDLYEQMSPQQKWFFQELKRHGKRANYSDSKTN